MSVLLRQSHGFEGLLSRQVPGGVDDLPITHRGHAYPAEIYWEARLAEVPLRADLGQHPLRVECRGVQHFVVDVRERLGEVLPPTVYAQAQPLPEVVIRKLPPPPAGTILVILDDKVLRLLEATRTIVDVLELK